MSEKNVTFTDEQIRALFGHEAAEDERPERLREYYFKSEIFEQVTADLPLRIVVGHKGIGKSALFSIAHLEDKEKNKVTVFVRPDDVSQLNPESTNFNEEIRNWKNGLRQIIAEKILERLNLGGGTGKPSVAGAGSLLKLIAATARGVLENKNLRLEAVEQALVHKFLEERRATIYMDDLDRGWQGRPEDIRHLSTMLNAVRDLSRDNEGLSFRVALRSDVYFLVRTADESTDKIETSVIWHAWTNHQILALLVKRIESFFGRKHTEASLMSMSQKELDRFLDPVIDLTFAGKGKWSNANTRHVIMSMIRRRPRDIVKLLTMAGREARTNRSSRIGTIELEQVFVPYSQERMQDVVNEYKSEMPDVERLIFAMKPSKIQRQAKENWTFDTASLLKKIMDIQQGGDFRAAGGRVMSTKELAAFLYKINFIIATKAMDSGFVDRKYFEEHKYLQSQFADFGYAWEVHPAYRWALQPDRLDEIFELTALTGEGKGTFNFKPRRIAPPGSDKGFG